MEQEFIDNLKNGEPVVAKYEDDNGDIYTFKIAYKDERFYSVCDEDHCTILPSFITDFKHPVEYLFRCSKFYNDGIREGAKYIEPEILELCECLDNIDDKKDVVRRCSSLLEHFCDYEIDFALTLLTEMGNHDIAYLQFLFEKLNCALESLHDHNIKVSDKGADDVADALEYPLAPKRKPIDKLKAAADRHKIVGAFQGKSFFYHKGHHGSFEANLVDNILHGQILGIYDLVLYEGNTLAELKASFEHVVDDYIVNTLTA